MTYDETIEDVLRRVRMFNDWQLINGFLRRRDSKPDPQLAPLECPLTCGVGSTGFWFRIANSHGYDSDAAHDIVDAADNMLVGDLRLRLLLAARV